MYNSRELAASDVSVECPAPEEFLNMGRVPNPGPGGEAEHGHEAVPAPPHPGHLVQTPRPAENAQRPRLKTESLGNVVTAVNNPVETIIKVVILLALNTNGFCISE